LSWKRGIEDVGHGPNVVVKLEGLGMDFTATIGTRHRNATCGELVPEWRPYIESCIAALGPGRCMFERNVTPDAATCSYGALWNTFKRITVGYSASEKAAHIAERRSGFIGFRTGRERSATAVGFQR
jgi:predicted TIM-barrel fold metal-dependent hydrolase